MKVMSINTTEKILSPNKQKINFKNESASIQAQVSTDIFGVSGKRDAAIINYLDNAQKRDKQSQIISASALGILALSLPLYIFYLKKATGSKRTMKEITNGFRSLKDDKSIPTLDTCKSLTKKMKEYLQTQLMYSKASSEDIKQV